MKVFIRLVGFGLFVGGWALAAAAMHVIVTPSSLVLIPKDRLGFDDTYVDARRWTMTQVRQHPAVVARLVHLDRAAVLAFAVNARGGKVEDQLSDAVEHPAKTTVESSMAMDKVKDQLDAVSKTVRSVFD